MSLAAAHERAHVLDGQDELSAFRHLFHAPAGTIYLDGNSLGLWSAPADEAVQQVLAQWKSLGIGGWLEASPPWFTMTDEACSLLAPLVGAEPDEVLVANSTTVNLHQLLATLYEPHGRRVQIVTDALAFPTDLYALQSHLRLRGRDSATDLILVQSRDGLTLDEDDIVAALTDDVQLVVLPSVIYTSGQLLDLPALARHAHRRGVLLGLDCSHSVGALPHRLSEWGVDFAFWCSYKYLNSGPGGVACLYLNRRHFGRLPGLAGWFGSERERQFDMAPVMRPAADARALAIGTPHVLSLAPLLATLRIVSEAGIDRLREKSLRLTTFLMDLADTELAGHGFCVVTPRADARRGGHVALVHPEALRICKALKAAGVVVDYRPPHVVRLAPVALYTCFADCALAIARLVAIMEDRSWEQQAPGRDLVP